MVKSRPFNHHAFVLQLASLFFLVMLAFGNCPHQFATDTTIPDIQSILKNSDHIADCFKLALEKGQFHVARAIVDMHSDQTKKSLVTILEQQIKRLSILEEEIVLAETTTSPIIKWGQNESHIFLSMKMSHRWDSPACLNTYTEEYSLQNNTLHYINICLVSHQRIHFQLHLPFYSFVLNDQQKALVKRDGVGIFSLIVQKAGTTIWPFLDQSETAYPIWTEIAERYNPEFKKYEEMLREVNLEKKSKSNQNSLIAFAWMPLTLLGCLLL